MENSSGEIEKLKLELELERERRRKAELELCKKNAEARRAEAELEKEKIVLRTSELEQSRWTSWHNRKAKEAEAAAAAEKERAAADKAKLELEKAKAVGKMFVPTNNKPRFKKPAKEKVKFEAQDRAEAEKEARKTKRDRIEAKAKKDINEGKQIDIDSIFNREAWAVDPDFVPGISKAEEKIIIEQFGPGKIFMPAFEKFFTENYSGIRNYGKTKNELYLKIALLRRLTNKRKKSG